MNAIEKRQSYLLTALNNIEGCQTHISMGNSKMGIIPSFSLLPIITCKNCGGCSQKCYATKGTFNYGNVINAYAENTALIMKDPASVENDIINKLTTGTVFYRFFRWNVSGDILSETYLNVIVNVAKAVPFTKFLAFTKNYVLINNYIDNGGIIPENLNIVFSIWENEPDNHNNLPTASVKVTPDTPIIEGAKECSGHCETCLDCWNIKKGQGVYFNLH